MEQYDEVAFKLLDSHQQYTLLREWKQKLMKPRCTDKDQWSIYNKFSNIHFDAVMQHPNLRLGTFIVDRPECNCNVLQENK